MICGVDLTMTCHRSFSSLVIMVKFIGLVFVAGLVV